MCACVRTGLLEVVSLLADASATLSLSRHWSRPPVPPTGPSSRCWLAEPGRSSDGLLCLQLHREKRRVLRSCPAPVLWLETALYGTISSELVCSVMACLEVETPTVCRGKVPAGQLFSPPSNVFLSILIFKTWNKSWEWSKLIETFLNILKYGNDGNDAIV